MLDDVDNVFCNIDDGSVEVLYRQGAVNKWVIGAFQNVPGEGEEGQDDGATVLHRGTFALPTTALGITAPALTDRLVIAGNEWEVEGISGDKATGMVTLSIVRATDRQVGRDVHRRRF